MVHRTLIAFALGALVLASCGPSSNETSNDDSTDPEDRGLLVLATRLDSGQARLVVYAADPSNDPLEVPAGTYYIESTDGERVATLGEIEVQAGVAVPLPDGLDDSNSETDREAAEALAAIVSATLLVDQARLKGLEAASANRSRPLFADGDEDVAATLEDLWLLYGQAGESAGDTLEAMDMLRERFAWNPAAGPSGPKQVSLGPRIALAQDGLKQTLEGAWESIKESFNGFFGYAASAGERASGDILIVAEEMTDQELSDAFGLVSPALTGGVTGYQDFLDKVARGDLDNNAAQIRSQLWADPVFATKAQQHCLCNSPSLHTAHQEGAELVSRGAELQAAIVQTALAAQFPGMAAGFEKAEEWFEKAEEWREQGDEWVEYLQEVYADPLGQLEAAGRERLEEALADRIGADIALRFPGMDEELADKITAALRGAVMERVPELADLAAGGDADDDSESDNSSASGGGSSAGAPVPAGGEPTLAPPTAVATVGPGATLVPTAKPTPSPSAPASPTAAASSPPTPAAPPATTAPPTSTATSQPAVVSGSVVFIETVSGGSIDAFQTTANLSADYGAGSVSGSLSGGGGGDRSFNCFVEGGPVLDTATVRYSASYSASLGGSLSGDGAFSAGFSVSGSISGQLSAPFTDPDCTHLNSEPIPGLGVFSGSGNISGTVSPSGAISVSTSWTAGSASVSGSGTGQGTVD